MAEFESVKFENYERELKYLVNGNITIDNIVDLFRNHEYSIVSERTKEKKETYYDTIDYSLIRSGEVIRASDYVTEQANGLMYKKNISNPKKPYVSKFEMGSTKAGTIAELLSTFNIHLKQEVNPVMLASMTRYVTIMKEKNSGNTIYLTLDHVMYALPGKPETKQYEDMLEIEDWNTPNSMNGDALRDECLIRADKIIEESDLPLQLIKDTKPYRGYLLLRKSGQINYIGVADENIDA